MQFFEFSVACKYLMPRWRQLSVSIISLISILVISLVVWLIVVFFSVTHGLEKNWVQKLIALTAPIRITPTEDYYNSYYYQIDGVSADSDYTLKSFKEKLAAEKPDPYDPTFDEEIPSHWVIPDLDQSGELKDIVKIAFNEVEKIKDVSITDYEMTFGNIRLRLLRDIPKNYVNDWVPGDAQNQSFLKQSAYFGSFDSDNALLKKALIPINAEDITNLLNTLTLSSDNIQHDNPDTIMRLDNAVASQKIHDLLKFIDVKTLKAPSHGWTIPRELFPDACSFEGCLIMNHGRIDKLVIPQNKSTVQQFAKEIEEYGSPAFPVTLRVEKKQFIAAVNGEDTLLQESVPIVLEGGTLLSAQHDKQTPASTCRACDLVFDIEFDLQNNHLSGKTPLNNLEIADAAVASIFSASDTATPFWLYQAVDSSGKEHLFIPSDVDIGESVLLPRSFREAGILVGDRGYLSYYSPTASSVQEQRIPVAVAGFYDPGIMPLGGKLILANDEVTSFIRSSQSQEESALTNGFNVRFDNLDRADEIKASLSKAFEKAGISRYWKIETYREFEFTKDIIQQLHSEKNLFSLLAIVIIVVACSNIISMLIILVNDKKLEIGILRSMGASSTSIALIFGLCGVIMGLLGSVTGIGLAVFTLRNLQSLVSLLSELQGHEMFNPAFYGDILPNEVSFEALGFVIIMTAVVSTIAGIVPAVKACLLRPSEILRSE
ncbi:MAG: FtsX-like permease family protein [Chlamydiota bacterium]|nr:FtsX-like permease family protein [Chlamydiota bacterium]